MNKKTYEALGNIIYGKEGSQKKRLEHLYSNADDWGKVVDWMNEVAGKYQ